MYTKHDIEHILSGFKDLTLPKAEWTHRAHIVVAAGFLTEFGLQASVPLLREGIKTYNLASGGVNNDVDGYHETVTMFWIIQINAYMQKNKVARLNEPFGQGTNVHEWINEMLSNDFTEKNSPFQYYSEVLFCSTKARHNWVEPNLKALEVPVEMGL